MQIKFSERYRGLYEIENREAAESAYYSTNPFGRAVEKDVYW